MGDDRESSCRARGRWLIAVVMVISACSPHGEPATVRPVAERAVAADAASIAHGREIAGNWCASCHIVSPGQQGVANRAAGAPRFVDVAHRWAARPDELRRFMDELHLPMPTFRLWPGERDDVVAYLISLDPAADIAR